MTGKLAMAEMYCGSGVKGERRYQRKCERLNFMPPLRVSLGVSPLEHFPDLSS